MKQVSKIEGILGAFIEIVDGLKIVFFAPAFWKCDSVLAVKIRMCVILGNKVLLLWGEILKVFSNSFQMKLFGEFVKRDVTETFLQYKDFIERDSVIGDVEIGDIFQTISWNDCFFDQNVIEVLGLFHEIKEGVCTLRIIIGI
ncbi:MAG: hypothetical protein Q4P27_01585 [Eubacteriales bacterium]|nr:hypothetical protein [Eubacteriales bacterium]